jgi:hypothetical protein
MAFKVLKTWKVDYRAAVDEAVHEKRILKLDRAILSCLFELLRFRCGISIFDDNDKERVELALDDLTILRFACLKYMPGYTSGV